jgi:intracellular multiplication protein IcmL
MMLRICVVLGFVIGILVLCIVTLVMNMKVKPVYFATTMDGRIINIVPVNEPYRSQGDVIKWSVQTARTVFSFGYNNYRAQLQDASNFFTQSGWDSFSKALKDSQMIEAVTARKQIVSLDVLAPPEILKEGVDNGIYAWRLQMPVMIKYEAADPLSPTRSILEMRIVRVSTLQNSDGISIEQWALKRPQNGAEQ